jgi:enterochelin esterase family protein
MPAVEHEYKTARGRENRAITGLSMGGLESLNIGLNHPELFAYVGGFSSALQERKFDTHIPNVDARKANLKLLWIACGTEDHLTQPNLDFIAWARDKGYSVTPIQTPGAHTWMVWRDNLLHFAPLLFR